MHWTQLILEKLKTAFNKRPFIAAEATEILRKDMGYSMTAIRQAIYQLTKEGCLIRIGRGIYKFQDRTGSVNVSGSLSLSSSVTVIFTSGTLIQAENLLKEKGIDYMITGPSALTRFHQHLPRKLIHLIYVINGAGEYACSTLNEHKLRSFLNTTVEQVNLLLDSFEDRDLFIIREYAKLEGNIEGRATIERAIVDTYFEATRNRIPFSELEVGRVIANVFKTEKLSLSQLLYFADRHGIKSEFQSIIKELEPDIPLFSGPTASKTAEKVIEGIRSGIRGY
jgi:hypothetical protein